MNTSDPEPGGTGPAPGRATRAGRLLVPLSLLVFGLAACGFILFSGDLGWPAGHIILPIPIPPRVWAAALDLLATFLLALLFFNLSRHRATLESKVESRTRELQESEARLRLALEGSNTGLWDWNLVTNEVYFSPTWKRQLGYADEEIRNDLDEWHTRLHPSDRSAAVERVRSYLARPGELFEQEFRLRHKNGSYRWILARSSQVRDQAGRPVRLLGAHLDLTERRQMEADLRQSESRYRTYVDQAADALFVHDFSGRYIDVNQRACASLGYERDELVGMTLFEVEVDYDRERAEAVWSGIVPGRPVSLLGHHRRKDGSVFPVEVQLGCFDFNGLRYYMALVHDITERVRAQRALKESEERYRQLFNVGSDAVLIVDLEAPAIVEANEAAERLYGWNRDELRAMSPAEIAVEPEATFAAIASAPGTPRAPFHWHRRKNGTVFPVEIAANHYLDRGRGMYVAAIRDITKRVAVEEAMHLRGAALAAAANAIVITDVEGEIEWANPAFTLMSGWPLDEAIGRNLQELLKSGRHDDGFYVAMWETIAAGRVWKGEVISRRKDGVLFIEEGTITPLHDEEGRITHFIAIKQDISERRSVEKALRETEHRFSKVFHEAPVGILITELEQGTILEANKEFLRISGFQLDEIIGRTPFGIGWAEPEAREAQEEKLRAAGRLDRSVATFTAKGGRRIDCLFGGEIVEIGGRRCLLSTLLDVTDARRLESQLRQAQKMEAVGQLAGGVAHDFNNILAAILLHLGLLREGADLSAENRSILQELEREASRAAAVTRQLLAFSRRQAMQVEAADLNLLVGDLLKMLRRLLGENIVVEWQGLAGLPAIDADPGMIEQVLVNLCVNARDAMPGGGRLFIRTAMATITPASAQANPEAKAGAFVRLSVIDTGCGMDEPTRLHLFEPFFTTKEAGRGTGLGLATVYGIVRQHGGWVEVETDVGKGSTFHVYLPAREAEAPAGLPVEPAPIPRGRGETVLVVEDERPLRRATAASLRSFGYRVVEASSGRDALRQWKHQRGKVDLVLSDMVMPDGLTGAQLVAKLRQGNPSQRAIITTGYMRDAVAEAAADIPILPKPFSIPTLLEAVRKCLDQEPD